LDWFASLSCSQPCPPWRKPPKRKSSQETAQTTESNLPTAIENKTQKANIIDITDPEILKALEEAFNAKEEAERAYLEAVNEQLELATAKAAVPNGDTPKKPSLIPSNAEEAKALLGKITDKLLGWLTSIKFLAQVGAIVLAYLLSPRCEAKSRSR